MSEKERPLPDSAADNFIEHDPTIDSFISSPQGPSTLQRVQGIEAEYAAQNLELKLLRDKYGIEDSRDELFREMLDEEVARTQEFVFTDEGRQQIQNTILRDWANLKGKPDDSVAAFTKPQRDRLRQEHQRLYPEDSEE